jgi:ABC-type glycerol-3-phosphate transport system permease component
VTTTTDGPARRRQSRLTHLPHHVVLVIATLLALGPIVFMIMTALKTDKQYLNDTLGPPWPLSFGNFREALHGGDFFIWLKNSAIMTFGAVVVSTVAAALCAFAIAQMRFRGQNLLLSVNIALLIVPPIVLLIPLFAQYADLGLIGTYRGVIIIYAGLTAPFSVYLLTSFFRTIPAELLESAMADGASHFRVLWQIIAPLSAPALVTLIVVNSLWVWNELLIALVFLPEDRLKTLMVGVTVFQGRYSLDVPVLMAGMLLASVPMLILYLIGQRFFIRGLTAGAIKG